MHSATVLRSMQLANSFAKGTPAQLSTDPSDDWGKQNGQPVSTPTALAIQQTLAGFIGTSVGRILVWWIIGGSGPA